MMWKEEEANHYKELEFGKTTVYKRRNPIFYNSDGEEIPKTKFDSLEDRRVIYDERQLTYLEYYDELESENRMLERKLKVNSDTMEFNEAVIQELILTTMGGVQ